MRTSRLLAALAVAVASAGCLPETGPGPGSARPPGAPRGTAQVSASLRAQAETELLSALDSTDPVIRAHAIEGLAEARGAAARTELLRKLADPDPLVRFAACMACGELRIADARPLLLKLVTDADSSVQVGAIFALHRLGDVRFSSGLEEALRSPEPSVRANAAFALGRLGEKSAVKILLPALRDRAPEVRLQSAEALWRLGNQQGLTYLVAAGISGNAAHQMVAILAMAAPRDRRVIEHVRCGKDSEYLEVRLVTARALGMLSSDEMFDIALSAVRAGESRQRHLAALALGAIGRPDAADALAALLKDPDPDVRVAAATAILQLR